MRKEAVILFRMQRVVYSADVCFLGRGCLTYKMVIWARDAAERREFVVEWTSSPFVCSAETPTATAPRLPDNPPATRDVVLFLAVIPVPPPTLHTKSS